MTATITPGLDWGLDRAMPEHPVWAVIRINDHEEISVLGIDGCLHMFECLAGARLWLRENKYECFKQLQENELAEYRLDSAIRCPPLRGYNCDLLFWMREQRGINSRLPKGLLDR